MNCLLNLLAVCVFDPSNVYVTAEMLSPINNAYAHHEGRWCSTQWCRGPVGEVRIGVTIDFSRALELRYGISHESMIMDTHDRGQESVFMQLTWRPFR